MVSVERQEHLRHLNILNIANRDYHVWDFDFPMSVRTKEEVAANELFVPPNEAVHHITHLMVTTLRRGEPIVIDDRLNQKVYAAQKTHPREKDNHEFTLLRFDRFGGRGGVPARTAQVHTIPRIELVFEGTRFDFSVFDQEVKEERRVSDENQHGHITTVTSDLISPVDWRQNTGSFTIATPNYPLMAKVYPGGYTSAGLHEPLAAAWVIRGALSEARK
jgi:hypothetical protein